MPKLLILCLALILAACSNKHQTIGSIERIDPALDSIIDRDARIEIIADGYKWSEGPLWIEDKKTLLFSDVFANKVFKWTEGKGAEVYLSPSGYTGAVSRGGELGSNGLILSNDGKLVLCQHGNRQVARMQSELDNPEPSFTALANRFNGKKLNSPNDGTFDSKGNLYFTDPPYGLEGRMEDPSKELPFQGVYKVKPSGETTLLCDSITRPNGIALFPGEKRLLVANSDSSKPFWYSFDIVNDSLKNATVFYNAAAALKEGKGLPDGLKIDRNGNVFATGPSGVFIFDSGAKLIGRIKLPVAAANCALSADEKTLFITATGYILRLQMHQ